MRRIEGSSSRPSNTALLLFEWTRFPGTCGHRVSIKGSWPRCPTHLLAAAVGNPDGHGGELATTVVGAPVREVAQGARRGDRGRCRLIHVAPVCGLGLPAADADNPRNVIEEGYGGSSVRKGQRNIIARWRGVLTCRPIASGQTRTLSPRRLAPPARKPSSPRPLSSALDSLGLYGAWRPL